MPNHVTNELIFRGVEPLAQDAILAKLCNASLDVDLGILVPPPINLWRGSVGQNHERAFKRTALDWNTENWGTKWNAYITRPISRAGDALTVVFDTAWRPPYPWLAAVFNTFERTFEHNWLDEGAGWSVSAKFDADEMKRDIGNAWHEKRAGLLVQERLHTLKWGVPHFEDEEEDQ